MASVTLYGNGKTSIKKLASELHREIKADLISEVWREFDDIRICLLIFEKFYLRSRGYASLTIMMTEYEDFQTADITGSGGGSGFYNFDMGVNFDFIDAAQRVLKQYDFQLKKDTSYFN